MKTKFLLLLLPAALLFQYKTSAQATNVKDSMALVNLYDSTDGADWTTNTNWLTKSPVSTWYGVTVASGRVTHLNLDNGSDYGNNMNGELPVTLGNLTALKELTLDGFGEAGNPNVFDSIPSSFGSMAALQNISLQGDYIAGGIPATLGNLTNLTYIALNDNQLTDTIPASLGKLPILEQLYLDDNLITGGLPPALGSLQFLGVLDVDTNGLTDTIPSTFGNLSSLYDLDLYDNEISGNIPSTFTKLTGLETLELGFNLFSGPIPSFLSQMKGLNLIDLGYNSFTGSIPASLSALTNLNYLVLSSNLLNDSIPSTLDNFADLTVCQVDGNGFTFAGMEGLVNAYPFADYAPQSNITIHQKGNVLSVSAGGTLSNNTYSWYQDDELLINKKGDSTLTIPSPGEYEVVVNNSIANELTLYSDSLDVITVPLTLLNFTGNYTKGDVDLKWITTSEVNTLDFIVQRSTDAATFTNIGTVSATDAQGVNTYTDVDTKPVAGIDYYRLKMVDKNGNYTYTNAVAVKVSGTVATALSVYPNPVVNTATVSFNAAVAGNYTLKITDMNGRVISNQKGASIAGTNTLSIDLSSYAQGSYFITFTDDANNRQTVKLTK